MNARERARVAHPAGKGIPESPEVVQARMDAEACAVGSLNWRVNEWHHEMSSRECPLWLRVAGQVVLIIGLFVLVMAASVVGELAGGWPL